MSTRIRWFRSIQSPCPACKGEGIFPAGCTESKTIACPTCHSKGIVMDCTVISQNEEMLCDNPNCENGKVMRTVPDVGGKTTVTTEDCPVCLGLNRIVRKVEESWEQPSTCPTCEGAGAITCETLRKKKLQVLCDTCHGVGSVFDLQKVLILAGGVGLVFLMPLVAFGVLLLGFMFFGLRTVLKKKQDHKTHPLKSKFRFKLGKGG